MYVRSSVPGSKIAGVPSGASFTASKVIACETGVVKSPSLTSYVMVTSPLKLAGRVSV